MNKLIEYFYGIKIDKIVYHDKYYSFIYDNYMYKLYIVDNNINISFLVDINRRLLGYTLISEIIMNKNGNFICEYNNHVYMLMKIYVTNKRISLMEINYLANSLYQTNLNINWGLLWSIKIDYLENLINENGLRYPTIVDSFNYFVGMAENAISYYNNIAINKDYKYVISHKNIHFNDTIECIYNPLNIIFDYRARDIAEYIKNSFFINNKDIFNELNIYFNNNYVSITDVRLIVARLLYPSFYFNMYEDILIDNKDEKIINNIIYKIDMYEKYLGSVIAYFRKFYDIDDIPWLMNVYNE